jgi:hypothetical protein
VFITHPECLLAQEIRVPRPRPQSLGDKPTPDILVRPLHPRTRPRVRTILQFYFAVFVAFGWWVVFIRLERVLLVVGRKLRGENQNGKGSEDIV